MNVSMAAAFPQPYLMAAAEDVPSDTADDLLYSDYPLELVDVRKGNSSGGWNETEYDYDYEEALGTFFWSQLAPPLAVYAATYFVGVTGNGLIIFTICRFRRLKTTTNVFLASLASADLLLILLCIPVKVGPLNFLTNTTPSLSSPFMCKIY